MTFDIKKYIIKIEGGEKVAEARRTNIYSGHISYERLWQTMERRNITKADLKNKFNLSPTTVNRFVKNENVSVDTIMYLCEKLSCQPCDILEYKK